MSKLNEQDSQSQSDSVPSEVKPAPGQHFFFAYGIYDGLLPALQEISDPEALVHSECTMELIACSFRDWKINIEELDLHLLLRIEEAMPEILEELQRLSYPLLQPELFLCAKEFSVRVTKAIDAQQADSRKEIKEVLKP